MKNKQFLLLFLAFNAHAISITSYIKDYFNQNKTFTEWAEQCIALPFLKDKPTSYKIPLSEVEFTNTLQTFIAQESVHLRKSHYWANNTPSQDHPVFKRSTSACAPFVQRLIVPIGSTIAFHGDLHGDIHALIVYLQQLHMQNVLENFKIKNPNFYMIFLGDYVDRGLYGCEVIYTLLRLKLANPMHVFLIRGNHEDLDINAGYNFSKELRAKYNNTQELFASINTLYNLLPVALYVGCNNNFLQCCHGGMEIGFNSHTLLDAPEQPLLYHWINELKQKTNALETKCSCFNPVLSHLTDKIPTHCIDIGFMWNDFKVEPTKNMYYNPSRGFVYNKGTTIATLKAQSTNTNTVCGVIRAHQHAPFLNSMMRSLLHVSNQGKIIVDEQHRQGLSTLWDIHATTSKMWYGMVCTLLVAPDTGYGTPYGSYPGFNYDTYALLTTSALFEEWDLQVYQNTLF